MNDVISIDNKYVVPRDHVHSVGIARIGEENALTLRLFVSMGDTVNVLNFQTDDTMDEAQLLGHYLGVCQRLEGEAWDPGMYSAIANKLIRDLKINAPQVRGRERSENVQTRPVEVSKPSLSEIS